MLRCLAPKVVFLSTGRLLSRAAGRTVDSFRRFVDGLLPLKHQKEVCGPMRVLGSPEYLILVLPQNRYPGCDVSSVLFRVVRNTAFRSEKYAGEFCAKFLFGVRRIAETVAFVECLAVQTGGMPDRRRRR